MGDIRNYFQNWCMSHYGWNVWNLCSKKWTVYETKNIKTHQLNAPFKWNLASWQSPGKWYVGKRRNPVVDLFIFSARFRKKYRTNLHQAWWSDGGNGPGKNSLHFDVDPVKVASLFLITVLDLAAFLTFSSMSQEIIYECCCKTWCMSLWVCTIWCRELTLPFLI